MHGSATGRADRETAGRLAAATGAAVLPLPGLIAIPEQASLVLPPCARPKP